MGVGSLENAKLISTVDLEFLCGEYSVKKKRREGGTPYSHIQGRTLCVGRARGGNCSGRISGVRVSSPSEYTGLFDMLKD